MRKVELGIIVAIAAASAAFNRPTHPIPAGGAATAPALPGLSPDSPYARVAEQTRYNLMATTSLFMDREDFLERHPTALLLAAHGTVQIYKLHTDAEEELAIFAGARLVSLSLNGKGKNFKLARGDGQLAPGLGATQGEVAESLKGIISEQSSSISRITSVKTRGENWTLLWRFNKEGIADSIQLESASPEPACHKNVGGPISPRRIFSRIQQ